MIKRLLILVMCAAIVASLVPNYVLARVDWGTDNPPPLINSFSAGGTTVDYFVQAWREDGELRGLTAATVRPGALRSGTVKIAAGVAVTVEDPERPDALWYTFPAYAGQKTLYASNNGLKTDMVYAPEGFPAMRSQRLYLRLLLVSKFWPWPALVTGIDSRCWTWRYPDPNLARDYPTEQQLEDPEHGFAVVGALLFIQTLGLFL